jgi:hypothetical protein
MKEMQSKRKNNPSLIMTLFCPTKHLLEIAFPASDHTALFGAGSLPKSRSAR